MNSSAGFLVRSMTIGLFVATLTKPAPAQTGAVPVFRSQSREVLVDVIVEDKNGHFVSDLKPDDFKLTEEGKPQRIAGFNVHRFKAATPLPPLALPPNQYTNFSQQDPGGAVTILLLDTLNTGFADQEYARRAMIGFLKRLPPGQPMGLFILSQHPHLVQGFTSSSDTLIAAASALKPEVSLLGPENYGSVTGLRGSPAGSPQAVLENVSFDLTVATLNALAQSVAGYSGRKNLIWLSGHFPLRLNEYFADNNRAAFGGSFSPAVKEAAALLAASQVAVYPVDVKGLGNATDSFNMDDLARETGGKAFYGSNAIDEALLRGVQQGSDYYTLSYVPENRQWNGQYRKIDVKLVTKGTRLTFRRGYYANPETPFTGDESAKALATAVHPLMPISTMLLLRVQVLPPDSEHNKVRIDYAVDSHDILFSDAAEQKKHAAVDFMAVAWDREYKNAGYATDTVEADFTPAVYQQIMTTGFPDHQELDLKPGTYRLRLGVIDRGSRKAGTVDVPLTIGATEPAKK